MVPVCTGVLSLRDDGGGGRDPGIAEECVVKAIFVWELRQDWGVFGE